MLNVKTQSVIDEKRRVIGLIAVLAVVVAGALGLTAPVASAHGSDVPWHTLPGDECAFNGATGVVKAFTPGRGSVGGYSKDWETIYWRADLWRYYSAPYNNWYKVDSSPWLRATGNYSGLANTFYGSWRDYANNGPAYNYWSFSNLSGSYAVQVTLYWASTNTQHSEWASMNGYSFCTL